MSKVVFVGNVPYNMGEDQLIDVFKSVGQVVGFRLVFDRETGKPKGYGFCEFADHETALSAVRNLNNVDVGGRPLRIDLADSDPFLEGKTTVRGELIEGQERERERERERGRGHDPHAFLAALPPGVPVSLGSTPLDTISQTLATMNPNQLMEVLAQMKAFVITHPEQARLLLVTHPQLAYALFQALLLNKIVDAAILQRMLAATSVGNPSGPPPAPAPNEYPLAHPPLQPPAPAPYTAPQHMYAAPQPPASVPPGYYRPPAPAGVPSAPAQTPAAPSLAIDPAQRAMLMQVLSLTPEQISALPPAERETIHHLRNQFMGGIPS